MLSSFGSLKSAVKFNRLCTETVIFFLHYRVTAIALLFCCILISADRFAGDKIKCLSRPNGEISTDVLNNYCWSTSTYSITSSYLKEVGVQVPHPGVEGSEKQEQYEYRNFYQYVHIVLFLQALLFYVPHMLWKNFEPDFLYTIKDEIQKTLFEGRDKAEETTLNKISTFIEERWSSFNILALKYFACELLAFFNLLLQAYLLDVFLHGKFISLGLFFTTYYNSEVLSDPIRLFPVVTVCAFRRYGPSGYIDVVDALCILPINAINGKIFLCVWIWFAILLPLTFASLIYLTISYTFPHFRVLVLKLIGYLKQDHRNESYMKLVTLGDSGDWFVLSSIKNNVDEHHFCYLTDSVLSKLPSLEVEDEEA